MKNKLTRLILIVTGALVMQGCIAKMVMNSQDHQHYSDYVSETQRLNFEREKANLPPQRIMTFNEWRGDK
jgi:hypothetical protein